MATFEMLRKAKGYSQTSLAKKLGVDQSAVSLWESGKTLPRVEMATRVAKLLDCTLDELFESIIPSSQISRIDNPVNEEAPTELIKVDYSGDKPAVSARELHEFLEVETPYHKWFPRMCEYGFTENQDFAVMDILSTTHKEAPRAKRMPQSPSTWRRKSVCFSATRKARSPDGISCNWSEIGTAPKRSWPVRSRLRTKRLSRSRRTTLA